MDNFVTPVLFRGLEELCRERYHISYHRPDMPIEFLAYYLIENNSMLKSKKNQSVSDTSDTEKDQGTYLRESILSQPF